MFIAIFAVILLAFGLLNFYVGLRLYNYLVFFFPGLNIPLYWIIFWLTAVSYLAGMFLKGVLPFALETVFIRVGSYWLAALVYLVLLFALSDLLLIRFPQARVAAATVILVITCGLLLYGTWNARHPRITSYTAGVSKAAGPDQSLRVALVSDIHLGREVGIARLEKMVGMVNGLDPDLVLFAGDFADRDYYVISRADVISVLKKLDPRIGAYAVLGNHDYYSGMVDELVSDLEEGGVKVLRDESNLVAGKFYLVGRDDLQSGHNPSAGRRSLAELMQPVDRSLPVILLDHQPVNPGEAESLGVDLMLSGHTHRGQLVPFNLITRSLFENDWGYLKKGNLNIIVSCGFGTWGPPVRLGNKPEVVDIRVNFPGNRK